MAGSTGLATVTAEAMLGITVRIRGTGRPSPAAARRTPTPGLHNLAASYPAADGLYLTMYGYVPDPTKQTVPAQNTWLTQPITWTHGKWTPAFMGGAKSNLHLAQGLGSIRYPGQMNTNVYFAGNNATADSEEGALDAAMIIAEPRLPWA